MANHITEDFFAMINNDGNLTQLHIETPLIKSEPLSKHCKSKVYLKLESLQPSSSFKIRGIGYLCQDLKKKGYKHFISSSGGNAGLAVAYAGYKLDRPVTVIIPTSTKKNMVDKIKSWGAKIICHGSHWGEADVLAKAMNKEDDSSYYIHPFDHPKLWEGHGSMITEVCNSKLQPDRILASVGGGGLLCGIIDGVLANSPRPIPITSVETKGAASFYESIRADQQVYLDKIDTVASSLGSPYICRKLLSYYKEYPIDHHLVSDSQALHAMKCFASDHQMIVEPACSATLALLYSNLLQIRENETILVIVCGGASVNFNNVSDFNHK